MTSSLSADAVWRTGVKANGSSAKTAPEQPQAAPSRGQPQDDAAATLHDADVPPDVLDRINRVRGDFNRAREAVAKGKPAGDSSERLALFAKRESEMMPPAGILASRGAAAHTEVSLERVLGKDDILLVGFLVAGMHAARSVGRIRLTLAEGTRYGTGFLVSPTMVLTNNHVLTGVEDASRAVIDFEADNIMGEPRGTTVCELDPARLFFTSKDLDITVVALADTPKVRADTESLGWHPMVVQEGKIRIGDPVNIIQYPGGKLKSVVMHNSNLMHLENDSPLHPFCWYTSDTERGSSGAPVFNNRWEVIGVHHRSIPRTDDSGNILATDMRPMTRAEFQSNPDRALFWANEGTRTSRIVGALTDKGEKKEDWPPTAAMGRLRDELLALWEDSRLRNRGQERARDGARSEFLPAPQGDGGEGLQALTLGGPAPTVINLHFHLPKG